MHKSRSQILRVLILILGLLLLAATNASITRAHDFQKFLIAPYYGAGNPSQRWNQSIPHWGIDFLLRTERWDRVLAAADGTIEEAGWYALNCHDESAGCTGSGLGLRIRIRHTAFSGHTMYTHYGHLSVARPTGQVLEGEWIGTSGDSGYTCADTPQCTIHQAPHLHFEVTHGCTVIGGNTNTCSVNPDNADGAGTSLWKNGEWSGSNPTQSKATKRYVTLGSYNNDTIVDDTINNTGGFKKGSSGTLECPPNNCPYWNRVMSAGYTNGGYYWTFDHDSIADYWAEYRSNLPADANYEVLVWMPCNSAAGGDNPNFTAWSAYYYVGNFGPLKVDQLTLSRYNTESFRRGCNRWIGLGIYSFPAGTSSYVRVTDQTDETGSNAYRKVGVDAVKFVRVNIGRFEAEKPFKKVKKTDQNGIQHEWIAYTNGLYGGNYISARQNTGANINTNIETYSPKIRFNVIFPTAGVYHVWIRGYGATNADDSIHAGFLGTVSSTADKIFCSDWNHLNQNGLPNWYWCKSTIDGQPATIDIAEPGTSVFELWMREDGFNVDQIVLTKDPSHDEQAISTNSVPFIFPGDDTSEDDDP